MYCIIYICFFIYSAFRNEITPRNFLFRSREFEMMEVEYFIPPENYYSEKVSEFTITVRVVKTMVSSSDSVLFMLTIYSISRKCLM